MLTIWVPEDEISISFLKVSDKLTDSVSNKRRVHSRFTILFLAYIVFIVPSETSHREKLITQGGPWQTGETLGN